MIKEANRMLIKACKASIIAAPAANHRADSSPFLMDILLQVILIRPKGKDPTKLSAAPNKRCLNNNKLLMFMDFSVGNSVQICTSFIGQGKFQKIV